jgi:peptidoglycan/LPS O-acetylase OafA/YrhL
MKPYLQKRALRIVPAYYAVLFLAAAGAFPAYEIAPDLMGLRLAYHMLFFQDYLPANIVVVFWSLGVEEKFYLLAPLLVLARANAASLRERVTGIGMFLCIAVVLRVITAVGKPDIDNYDAFFVVFRSPLHMTLDPILMGVLLAFIYRAREEVPRLTAVGTANYVFWSGAILLALLTGIGAMMGDIGWWDKTLQPTAIAIGFSAITFGLLFGGGPAAIFRTALLRFFARISYSLYLVHLPLVPLSLLLANRVSDAESGFGVFFTIFVLLSIVAALLIHFAIEKPFLLIKDRIDQGRRNA